MTRHLQHHGSRHSADLTAEEVACLKGRKEGKSDWEMARILQCSEASVAYHIESARKKVGAKTDEEAVEFGVRHRLIT
ncbi:helix-turn-helix transcriptional regulator [Burkholderia pseudomultivorans]|uniref:helix-turn-helix transcriptional regulator n=1 Tax=Burkholderia pseudomultivorans TaxID=1207504 RepID=UPI000A9F3B96|nr:helix-turn-helix transcriptional regulator [Burkholderia pseudomultivorans]